MNRHICSKCKIYTDTEAQLERIFGYRSTDGKLYPQSQCKHCRKSLR